MQSPWSRFILSVLLAAGGQLALAPAASCGEEQQLQAFEARYASIISAVDKGDLPRKTGSEAQALRMTLRKDLIRLNARLEILKLEVAEYQGAEQKEAIEKLIAAGAERERLLIESVHRLERLAEKDKSMANNKKEFDSDGNQRTKILLDFAPDDVTGGEFD